MYAILKLICLRNYYNDEIIPKVWKQTQEKTLTKNHLHLITYKESGIKNSIFDKISDNLVNKKPSPKYNKLLNIVPVVEIGTKLHIIFPS